MDILVRSMDLGEEILAPVETCVSQVFLPVVVGQPALSGVDRRVLRLPIRHGGMAIPDLVAMSANQRRQSRHISEPLVLGISVGS